MLAKISLICDEKICLGLKFAPSANKIDRAKLKRELEEYGRKLCLMRYFRNDERTFSNDTFRPKCSLMLGIKISIIETYLSCLEKYYWT